MAQRGGMFAMHPFLDEHNLLIEARYFKMTAVVILESPKKKIMCKAERPRLHTFKSSTTFPTFMLEYFGSIYEYVLAAHHTLRSLLSHVTCSVFYHNGNYVMGLISVSRQNDIYVCKSYVQVQEVCCPYLLFLRYIPNNYSTIDTFNRPLYLYLLASVPS
jgi:hypothetical protein